LRVRLDNFDLGLAVNRLEPVEKQNNLSGMCAVVKGDSSADFGPLICPVYADQWSMIKIEFFRIKQPLQHNRSFRNIRKKPIRNKFSRTG
jgi:hypothetical protein